MIVKNEEALLARCLESVKDADEIIICDTGSVDRTIEVARQFTDKVYTDFTWCDHFAKARNHAKSKATGDWILSIDADEYCHDFSKVREAADNAFMAVDCKLFSEGLRQFHWYPRLFRNSPLVQWVGAVHNHLSVLGEQVGDVQITYGYSPAHLLDPDRSLRILEREVTDINNIRERFYCGREYWYRRRYEDAVRTLGLYVQQSQQIAEKADAFMIMARCYWAMRMPDDARSACMHAVVLNPTWYEPLEFMAYASGLNSGDPRFEANAAQWMRMAAGATNEGVLFYRPPGPETPIARGPVDAPVIAPRDSSITTTADSVLQ